MDCSGVEVTTGPLGKALRMVGMAIAEAHLAALFNQPGYKLIDHYIYAIVTDGDLMEGVASDALLWLVISSWEADLLVR